MRMLVTALTVFFVLAVVNPSLADDPKAPAKSASEVLKSLQQSGGEIEQIRAALRGPDPSVRVAAFAAMIESNNPALMALAIQEGHAASDAVLRDLAMRAAFREVTGFTAEPVKELSQEAHKMYMNFADANGVYAKIQKYDWTTGTFTIFNGNGQISGTHLGFRTSLCQGSLAGVENSWKFEGTVVCVNGSWQLTAPMRVTIR